MKKFTHVTARHDRPDMLGRSSLQRDLVQRVDDAVHDLLDQIRIVSFGGDSDHRFGAGGTHNQSPVTIQPLLGAGDRRADLGVLGRSFLAYPVVTHTPNM